MKRTDLKWRSCLKKVVYRELSAAEARVSEMKQEVLYNVMEPQAYQCYYERHWHVGHQEVSNDKDEA